MANPYEDQLSSTGKDTLANSDLIELSPLQDMETKADIDLKSQQSAAMQGAG